MAKVKSTSRENKYIVELSIVVHSIDDSDGGDQVGTKNLERLLSGKYLSCARI